MDNQGENMMPNGMGGQAPSGGMPPNPNYNGNEQPSNVAPVDNNLTGTNSVAPTSNVAQHVLVDSSATQPTTPNVASTTPETTRTAIFSTPADSADEPGSVTPVGPTTISSADVAIPETDPNEAARIHAALGHPYFSNHPTQTASSGIGDVVIDNRGPRTKRKMPKAVVFGLIGVAVVAVVATVLWNIFGGTKKLSKADVIASYNEYANYVQFGPEEDDSQDGWFLLSLADGFYPREKQLEFTNKATELFRIFNKNLNELKTTSSKLQNSVQYNGELLNIIVDYINLQAIAGDNESTYLNSGEEAALKEIEDRKKNLNNTLAKNLEEKITQYLKNNISILNIYKQHSCIVDNSISDECVLNIADDAELNSLRSQNTSLDRQLELSYSSLSEEFEKSTGIIGRSLDE